MGCAALAPAADPEWRGGGKEEGRKGESYRLLEGKQTKGEALEWGPVGEESERRSVPRQKPGPFGEHVGPEHPIRQFRSSSKRGNDSEGREGQGSLWLNPEEVSD